MNIIKSMIMIFMFLLLGCGASEQSPNVLFEQESTMIYESIIDSLVIKMENQEWPTVLVMDSTEYFSTPYHYTFCEVEYFILDSLLSFESDRKMKQNFLAQNSEINVLSRFFKSKYQTEFLSSKDLRRIKGDSPFVWKRLYNKYPKSSGILVFSKIGFGPKNENALVYFSESKQSLSGWGGLIFLAKTSGRWKIQKIKRLWIS